MFFQSVWLLRARRVIGAWCAFKPAKQKTDDAKTTIYTLGENLFMNNRLFYYGG